MFVLQAVTKYESSSTRLRAWDPAGLLWPKPRSGVNLPGMSDEESASVYLGKWLNFGPCGCRNETLLLCCLRVGGWGEAISSVFCPPPVSIFKGCKVLGIIPCCESLCL